MTTLTPRQACALIGRLMYGDGGKPIHMATLHRWRNDGLPHRRFRGAVLFFEEEIVRFMDRKKQGVFL